MARKTPLKADEIRANVERLARVKPGTTISIFKADYARARTIAQRDKSPSFKLRDGELYISGIRVRSVEED